MNGKRITVPALSFLTGALIVAGARFAPPHDCTEHLSTAFRSASENVAASVVGIETYDRVRGEGGLVNVRVAQGSGLVVAADGLIVTNHHVVELGRDWRVTLEDGRSLDAELVGVDSDTDLALLRVEADGLTPAEFATDARVGDWVLAVGNPFGLQHSVTAGIISARGRSGLGITTYEDFLQTDAAINPGNSGGPLVDLAGRVVGINTAKALGSDANIGFAIPASTAQPVLTALIHEGRVARGWLGVQTTDAGERMRAQLGLDEPGAIVGRVIPDSPAEAAGVLAGDVILSIGGRPVDSSEALLKTIGAIKPGTRTEVVLWRDGERESIELTLDDRSSSFPR